ncbi:hypothetical protein ABEB36_014969 [Hypothenemus hampei]|uniref:Uncharacterized protein n=1 Tax=Hypothenemus hampei TaxID=57062 RepID=A0ABD1E1R0_HYPHA
MDEDTYLELLKLVTPLIQKESTHLRETIGSHERLTATLLYLATGRTYEDLKFTTAISEEALGKIIPETCSAVYKILNKKYLQVVMAYCVLHNYLRRKRGVKYIDAMCYVVDSTENNINSKESMPDTSESAKAVQELFKNYFNNEGAVVMARNPYLDSLFLFKC